MGTKRMVLIMLLLSSVGLVRAQEPTTLESYDAPGYFLATTTSAGPVRMIQGANLTEAGQWNLLPGLADETGVTFQSVALADHIMRHRSWVFYADPRATDDLFLNDATFFIRPGLADESCVSFESINYPGQYLQHDASFGLTLAVPPADLGAATFRFPPEHPELAKIPIPAHEATDVLRETDLSWSAGVYATTHDVYFGTSLDDVNNASRTNPLGVLVKQDNPTASYDLPGRLDFGVTYYWRIDEVNAAPASDVFKGEIWQFTVEPYSYPLADVNATASSSHEAGTGPEKTIDGSGLVGDAHSTDSAHMWLSASGTFPQTIEYMFDNLYKLDQMWVWNSNQSLESLFGLGAKDVLVQYSTNGIDWTDLGNFVFTQASGLPTYTPDIKISFDDVPAQYVRLTISSNWGGIFPQVGLSEVRFYYKPVTAREPDPAADATDVHPQVMLNWRAGREADSHDVYLGTDPNAVADGTASMATVLQPSYDVPVDLEQTYYWKVIEVNQAETPSAWESSVWSFSTGVYISVDNFESYTNDSPYRVFQTWIDGAGFSPDEFFPNGNNGNGTGALVGYDPLAGDVMETTLGYGGLQSMPLIYDGARSEADRTFDPPQDWTKHKITTLVLFFRGDPANGAAPVYVKINGTKVTYNNGAAATTKALWQPWNIDLASVAGANLQSVTMLTIGIGNGSASVSGTLFVDEIRLYATPPAIAVPADPGTGSLQALYSMESNVQDSSGKNLHGTANGDPEYLDSRAGLGKALAFDGVNDYVDLPIGTLISTLSNSTFAAWVNFSGAGDGWQRAFDFGNNTNTYMFMTVNSSLGGSRFAIRTSAVEEQMVTSPRPFGTGWRHLAVVIDSATMTLRLYEDGSLVDTGETELLPSDLGVTTQNWLGRSMWTDDPYYTGSLDDVRIYNRALSEGEIRYLAGDR